MNQPDFHLEGISPLPRQDDGPKPARDALIQSRMEFKDLFDNAPVGFHEVDEEGRLVRINDTELKMLGYSAKELLGQFVWKISTSEAASRQAALAKLHGELPPPQGFERMFRRKDGSSFPVWISDRILKREDGSIAGIRSAVQDITERRQSEEALREIQELFASAFEHAPVGIALISLEGRWLKVNQALCDLLGYSEPALLARTFRDLTHPDDLEDSLMNGRKLLAGEISAIHTEKRYLHATGGIVTILLNVSLLRDREGRPRHFIAQIQDLTERKRAEEALVRTSMLLEALLENTTEAIYFKDRESRFVQFSRKMLDLFKLTDPNQLVGRTDFDFFAPEHARPAFEAEQEIIRTGKPILNLEEKETLLDGRVSWALTSKMAWRDKAGNIIGTMGISRDITERKRLEAHLFQSQKMETVGKLAGGIAHEFNSLMTAIIGQSELLLSGLPPENPLGISAAEIRQAADRAATLTRQLLAYGRKQILQPEVLDLNTVLAGMENTLRHLAGRDVDVLIAPPTGPMLVKADPGQIEQVIVNIVMNAADAMPRGGKLTFETGGMLLDSGCAGQFPDLKPGDYVVLAISDTGTGIPEEAKPRLFEPFFTTKEVGKGTGLGLATCHGIIKQSGGHINVYSEPDCGATFKIYLPKVQPEKKPPGPPLATPELPRGTETILLVEDDTALRDMAAALLGRLGYTVLTAGNGLEALDATRQAPTGHIDLLFTDVVMPQMSGRELAGQVRALYPGIKILFTSAYAGNAIVHHGVLDKGMALLEKPFTPSALARKLREVLEQGT